MHKTKLEHTKWIVNAHITFNVIKSPYFQSALDGLAAIGHNFKGPSYNGAKIYLLADLKKERLYYLNKDSCLSFVSPQPHSSSSSSSSFFVDDVYIPSLLFDRLTLFISESCEETLMKLRRIIVSLQNEIDKRDHKLFEMECKHSDTLDCLQKLIMRLTEKTNYKERCLLEMECKYNEALSMVEKLKNDKDEPREGCCNVMLLFCSPPKKNQKKDLPQMKDMVVDSNHNMECLKEEHGKITKQLEESKALNELQQKNFIEEIQKLRRELHNQSDVESDEGSAGNLNTAITTFQNQLKDKMEYLERVENLNSFLVVKEQEYKQELLDARKESINSLQDMFCSRSQLGIKRLGELDPKPFRDSCSQKYSNEPWQEISAMLCSSWEDNLKNSAWHPFKITEVNGVLQVTKSIRSYRASEAIDLWRKNV
ncbi:hypothetical protein Ahy_A03g011363 isoform E [Arachis hypogaea]|uniref:Factor of DNA methylation 1-5/IDN2 domain-containing protein n=1 Tax=Arachis hypogaea TaxID=3818 RepID=A0A445DQI5_ARAHY|nr:hypothetical protein Ahy_A03g011363 isoform E [Arachis hypogaea]